MFHLTFVIHSQSTSLFLFTEQVLDVRACVCISFSFFLFFLDSISYLHIYLYIQDKTNRSQNMICVSQIVTWNFTPFFSIFNKNQSKQSPCSNSWPNCSHQASSHSTMMNQSINPNSPGMIRHGQGLILIFNHHRFTWTVDKSNWHDQILAFNCSNSIFFSFPYPKYDLTLSSHCSLSFLDSIHRVINIMYRCI